MYRLASIPVLLLVMGVHGATRPSAPASIGERTLERMHAAYAGSWYHTLTFRQKTTVYSDTGAPQIQQWYESLAELNGRTLLRIDRGSPADGNGVLYTSDSAYVVRKGVLAVTRPSGNEFLPLIEGVYVQPVTQTADELRRQHFEPTALGRSRAECARANGDRVLTDADVRRAAGPLRAGREGMAGHARGPAVGRPSISDGGLQRLACGRRPGAGPVRRQSLDRCAALGQRDHSVTSAMHHSAWYPARHGAWCHGGTTASHLAGTNRAASPRSVGSADAAARGGSA
jgi:hypothetical protein